jgi:hypothetical protein
MDVYCPICAEPIDNDELHDVAEANKQVAPAAGTVGAVFFPLPTTYAGVAADFRKRGCKALEAAYGPQPHCKPGDADTTEAIATVYDLLGDDMDGAASTLEDWAF